MGMARNTSNVNSNLEKVVHHASDTHSIIAVTDANGVITYVNRNFLRLSGYSWDELVGKTHAVVNSDFHPPEFFEKLWQHISLGKPWRGNIRNRAKNGDFYWVDTTICAMVNDQGTIVGYTSVRTDITAVVAEKDRRKQDAENAFCLKALYDIVYEAIDLTEVLERAVEQLFSVSWLKSFDKGGVFIKDWESNELQLAVSHNLIDKDANNASFTLDHFIPDGNVNAEEMHYVEHSKDDDAKSPQDEESYGYYHIPLKYDGRLLGALLVYIQEDTHLSTQHGEFLNSFCNTLALLIRLKQKQIRLNDEVARSNRLAKKAQLASEKATQAAEAKANFLATMSHEIRTPMNSVLGMLYLMEQSDLTEEQLEYASMGKSSAESLMHIIDDILDYTKYEQGAFTLEEIEFELRSFLTDSLEPFREPARAKGLELFMHVNERLPTHIVGDSARIRQLITNLVSNALKFTAEGQITMKVDLAGNELEPEMMIMVSDTGTGIDVSALEHIFERFSQADSSITREYGGTGLGLAISRKLARAMKGEIGVDTVLDEGSTFWIRLPLIAADVVADADEANEEDAKLIEADAPKLQPLNILVAEDNMSNQYLMRKILEVNAHMVTCVENGLLAVEQASTTQFDVILMDLQMPVMDGLCAAKEIRRLHQPYGNVPIYAVSANALSKHHAQSKEAGMDGHLNKPIMPAELYEVLDKVALDKQEYVAPLEVKFA